MFSGSALESCRLETYFKKKPAFFSKLLALSTGKKKINSSNKNQNQTPQTSKECFYLKRVVLQLSRPKPKSPVQLSAHPQEPAEAEPSSN